MFVYGMKCNFIRIVMCLEVFCDPNTVCIFRNYSILDVLTLNDELMCKKKKKKKVQCAFCCIVMKSASEFQKQLKS